MEREQRPPAVETCRPDSPSKYQPNIVPEHQLRLIDRTLFPSKEPLNAYGRKAKWTVTVLVSAAAAIDSISTNIFYPGLPQIPQSLSTYPSIANLAVALPTLSSAICPLYWSYAAEYFGRRPIYLVALLAFIVFSALSAISTSIGMLIAFRILSAGAGAAVTPTGAGVVADMWEVKEKGKAMSAYYVGILLGPALGPVLGGLLTQRWDWRATQWFQMAYGGLVFLMVLFLLPETSVCRQRNAAAIAGRVGVEKRLVSQPQISRSVKFYRVLTHPLHIISHLRSPVIILPIAIASITFLVVKALQISLQDSFSSSPYNFRPLIIGLVFIPFAIGLITGDLAGGKWSDYVIHRVAFARTMTEDEEGRDGVVGLRPEDRLGENAWVAGVGLVLGLLAYGWCVEKRLPWEVPLLFVALIGLSAGLTFSLITTVLVEIIPSKSASLVALNGLGRNVFATVGTAVSQPVQERVGSGWLFSICAGLAVGNLVMVGVVRRWGGVWRGVVVEREGGEG